MKPIRLTLAAGVLVLAACADQSPVASGAGAAAPLLSAAAGGIDGEYIVVLEEGADPRAVAAIAGATPRRVYTAALNGFAATLSAGQLNALRHHPGVAYVEQDQQVQATRGLIHWGLDRIDQRSLPLDGQYFANTGAPGVYAYVIDTGISTAHTEFGGRASNVYDAFGGTGADCNGHGTLVARTIGSSSAGVAKAVRLRGVRVLDCNGAGTISGIIAGVDWVRLNRVNPAVANLSLGGGASLSLNTAVNNLANSGVAVAVAAGNGGTSACNVSPAGATAALTTAASTITDASSAGTNYGNCVDLYAPGSAPDNLTGTVPSFSSAYVAGVAALYKATFGNQPTTTVNSWITTNATPGILTGVPPGTPNRLLYKSNL